MIFLEDNKLSENIEKLNAKFEKMDIEDLRYVLGNKKQVFIKNFLAGIARGVGIGIGVTIITAILIIILQRVVTLNIPVIGDYVADIVEILKTRTY